jgi:XapX domain-containing protein
MLDPKVLLGLFISFMVGVVCRFADIPVPSPPVLSGALLVFMMSLGYWLVDRYIAKHPATQKCNCGGHDIGPKKQP